ncbi:hypothetical protein OG350_10605 [Streptomyces achromogenes]|uniref:Uncharacterized protein n=1 Tax=Streptomyces achromogenes TaxID=67255 RepID=A0ABZ1KNK5_STRAH
MTGAESPACVPGRGLLRGRTAVLTDDAQVRALFETAEAAHGRLDVVAVGSRHA